MPPVMPTNLVVMQDDVLSFEVHAVDITRQLKITKRLLHGTLRFRSFPTDKTIQNGLPKYDITRDAIATCCGPA